MISLKCPVCGNPVDEAIDGGCSKRCDDIFHGVEEMTDTKAALDEKFDQWFYTARDPVKDLPYGSHLIYRVCDNDKDRFEIGCELLKAAFVGGHESALTTPPAPTVMGDETMEDIVQEITYHLNQARCIEKRTVGNRELASRIFENLALRGYIRAATQPQQATDVNYLIRDLDIIRVILESSKDAVIADFQRIERLQDFIRNAALESPAVPREAIEAELLKAKHEIEDAGPKAFKYAGQHIDEALALLGGKEG